MTQLLSRLVARVRSSTPSSHYGRAYIFLLVALTIFLLSLACWRQPVTGYTARVVLMKRAPGSDAPAADADRQQLAEKLRGELLSPEAWKALAGGPAPIVAAEEITAAAERTSVHVHPQPQGEMRIVVWHTAPSADQSVAVVQSLAERFAVVHSQQFESRRRCQQCDAAQAEVARTAAALKQAQGAVDAYRQQHAAELSPPRTAPSVAATPAATPTPAAAPSVTSAPNPLWQELSDQLDVLRAAHAKLLQQRTAEHPGVIDLAMQIKQTEAQLAATPRSISSAAPENDTPKVAQEVTLAEATPAAFVGPSPEVVEQLQKLTTAADLATRRHEEALAAERAAWQQRWSQPAEQVTIVEPAQVVQRHGGGPSKAGVLLTSLLALAAGGAVAWRSQVAARPRTLVSAAQVESLGLPVIAVLATRDGPSIPTPQLSNPPWIRYVITGCEMTLAVILALLAVVVLADWQVAAQAIWDPLAAFSEAIWRLTP